MQRSFYSLPYIHQSEVWMLVLTYFKRLMYTSAKTNWHLYFHFFQLSLSWWLIVCNDAWLLPQRKKDWSPLHSTSPFLEDFVTATLRVVGPLPLGIYKIDLHMSVTHLGLHYRGLASQMRLRVNYLIKCIFCVTVEWTNLWRPWMSLSRSWQNKMKV